MPTMITVRRASAILALGVGAATAACGGSTKVVTDTDRVTVTAAAAKPTAIPDTLVGTYETARPAGQFHAGTWQMAIGPQGETFITPPGETGFFTPPLRVEGSAMVLPADPDAGCGAVGRYRFTLAGPRPGGTLTLTANDPCPGRAWVMANTWKRTD
jgi:hypothetical protein